MCTRFKLSSSKVEITARFELEEMYEFASMPEIRPTNIIPVILDNGQVDRQIWGIPAPWDGKPLIHARSETLAEKTTFAPLLSKRCLVPATAYYEWRKDGKKRHKNEFTLDDQNLFAFAGLTNGTHTTIITCNPAPEIAHIHERMPVILDKAFEKEWLSADNLFADVAPLLRPYPGKKIRTEEDTIIDPQPDLFDL